jgi:hypothetical protein
MVNVVVNRFVLLSLSTDGTHSLSARRTVPYKERGQKKDEFRFCRTKQKLKIKIELGVGIKKKNKEGKRK